MTPITDAERLTWQRQAHAALGRLLERASKEKLPPIRWSLSPAGRTVLGEISSFGSSDPRGMFAIWRTALGQPDRDREHKSMNETRLTAVWENLDGCQVVLVASIWDDEPAGE